MGRPVLLAVPGPTVVTVRAPGVHLPAPFARASTALLMRTFLALRPRTELLRAFFSAAVLAWPAVFSAALPAEQVLARLDSEMYCPFRRCSFCSWVTLAGATDASAGAAPAAPAPARSAVSTAAPATMVAMRFKSSPS